MEIEKDEETEGNNFDLVFKIVSACVNEGSGKNNIEQRRCGILYVCLKESSGNNNKEQNKSGAGSPHTNRISDKNNTEQHSSKLTLVSHHS